MLIACSSCQDKQEPPKNLIPEEKMVDIMYEMALIQAIKSYDYKLMDNKNVNPSQAVAGIPPACDPCESPATRNPILRLLSDLGICLCPGPGHVNF